MKTVKEKFKKIFGESAFVALVKIKRKLFKLTYLEREKRWIRGDWQIASWIEKLINQK